MSFFADAAMMRTDFFESGQQIEFAVDCKHSTAGLLNLGEREAHRPRRPQLAAERVNSVEPVISDEAIHSQPPAIGLSVSDTGAPHPLSSPPWPV